ncbi:3782_t:CDS:2 [Racocetra persica]|uniref:3782_t:CDS:1 n=1 Tax=Racocetra persica TaxID=160502 RepID=A0ACA9KKP8_9GLOM|nr:3782_t:CDS:2 [Racocetra persica]
MPTTSYSTPPTEVGSPIPANTPHAISVALPTWQDNVDYEEGRERVVNRMLTGYPRFFINKQVEKLMSICEEKFAKPSESCLLFPNRKATEHCRTYLRRYFESNNPACFRLAEITIVTPDQSKSLTQGNVTLHIIFFPKEAFSVAKSFWQHTGDGISSRLAEFALNILQAKSNEQYTKNLYEVSTKRASFCKRYSNIQTSYSRNLDCEPKGTLFTDITSINDSFVEQNFYVEERYGRNLPMSFAEKAKLELRRRIASSLKIEENKDRLDNIISSSVDLSVLTERLVKDVTENEVFLFPSGMSSIFHAHRFLLTAFPPRKRCHFYGNGSSSDIDEIESLLESGERVLALFCEFPSNPLCKSPDLKRLRTLADKYDFPIVIDETIGNFVNVKVFEWADILVSSLTKIFSGDKLKKVINNEYEDLLWGEDAIVLERNSRTFRERIMKINENAEEICELLRNSPKVKKIYYPKYITPEIYLQYKTVKGGFGGLFSVIFHSDLASQQFFDSLIIAKGPSLGTNFTLACPYTILAHYNELDWASGYGVEPGIIRVSIGLEDKNDLLKRFQQSLDAITE